MLRCVSKRSEPAPPTPWHGSWPELNGTVCNNQSVKVGMLAEPPETYQLAADGPSRGSQSGLLPETTQHSRGTISISEHHKQHQQLVLRPVQLHVSRALPSEHRCLGIER